MYLVFSVLTEANTVYIAFSYIQLVRKISWLITSLAESSVEEPHLS
jgi:hypothetical protein